jgi:tRNA threonylcarbamoyladenosine biosynthesis protein TsaB
VEREGWLVAVESAGEPASVALARGGEPLAVRALPSVRPASETLLPTLLALLAAHSLAPAEIDAFAVSIGPGSFTGLRVGVATVKGLAFGGARVAAVPTLGALAAQGAARAPGLPVLALLDARRGEVYAAGYGAGEPLASPRFGPAVFQPEALAERAAALGARLVVVGPELEGVERVLRERLGEALHRLPGVAPDAGWVARLGARMLAAGGGVDAAEIAPLYVRRAEAEVRRRLGEGVFDTVGDLS